ncbi:MAG: tRNA (adenosine(37)-N6)-threonylcarbamoyltransferase complex ATPase subunit type 1 TsaE [Verrucomicrobiota bacterium]|jgi:tRNA threonylcarbamoyladenosine biosynthesis protein TsaE
MVTFISHSPSETEELGEGWGRECGRGWIIGLSGELGAGKTQLVKGLARGLKAGGRVTSPTYALVHEYPGGRLPFFHVDLYRLETREQIRAAGLGEYLWRRDGVTAVEWVERWLEGNDATRGGPGRFRRARLKILGETEREICYEDIGG